MSPSVLYLAIIAIWALFLVPAWLRRGHATRTGAEGDGAFDAESDAYPEAEDDCEAGDADLPLAGRGDRPGDPVEFEEDETIGWEEAPAGPIDDGRRREVTFEDDYAPGAYYDEPEPAADQRRYERPARSAAADLAADRSDRAAAEPTPSPAGYARTADPGPQAAHPAHGTAQAGQAARAAHAAQAAQAGQAGHAPAAHAAQAAAQRLAQAGRAPQSRQQMLRARRRMLTLMLALAAVTGAGSGLGLLPWWASIPPGALLFMYVLLLREVAMAEAEAAAHLRHAAQAQASHRRERTAWAAAHGERQEQTAEVIDISSRVGDQLYDQYADAAVRAVGD